MSVTARSPSGVSFGIWGPFDRARRSGAIGLPSLFSQYFVRRHTERLLEAAAEMRQLAKAMRERGFGDRCDLTLRKRSPARLQSLRPDPAHRRRSEATK